jgi:tellurite resistance protein TerC
MADHILFWIGFNVLVIIMMALDLGVFHKKTHKVPVKEAVVWTIIWVTVAMIFNVLIYFDMGKIKALEFFTGYVIEYSLSVDNLFVFILIFSYFKVSDKYQHKVLFWGIIGALIMRGIFIFAGVALINRFHWIIYIFGGFLVYTGVKMLVHQDVDIDPAKNPVVRFARKYLPVTDTMHEDKFFIRKDSRRYVTPLFLVLLIIESSDLIFAVDSIPAVLAISYDRFIVYTSNIFAILGLRSLYFAISGIMEFFRFLKVGVAFVLTFVGLKMCISNYFEIPVLYSLLVIVSILLISIIASVVIKKKKLVT